MNLPPNEFSETSLQLDVPPDKTILYGIEDLLEDWLHDEMLYVITSDFKARVQENIYSKPNEFSETSLNVIIPPKKCISYVIGVLLNERLDKNKLDLILSDDKTTEHQTINLPPNEFSETNLQFDVPPAKTVSYGIEDLLEDCLDDETTPEPDRQK